MLKRCTQSGGIYSDDIEKTITVPMNPEQGSQIYDKNGNWVNTNPPVVIDNKLSNITEYIPLYRAKQQELRSYVSNTTKFSYNIDVGDRYRKQQAQVNDLQASVIDYVNVLSNTSTTEIKKTKKNKTFIL